MAKFSSSFGLEIPQASLDFVDVDLERDTPLYLDPYAIQIRSDEWSEACGDHIRSFFATLLDALHREDEAGASHLLNHLHEPNETFLGISRGAPSGRGVGSGRAALLADAIVNSRAFKSNVLQDISEAELFIHNVGKDTISDLTTNIVRGLLAAYTKEQCDVHEIKTQSVSSLGPVWDIEQSDWRSTPLDLPVAMGRAVLLVPKFSVRHRLSLDSQEFYNFHMIEYLRSEREVASGLHAVFKGKRRRVTKREIKEQHPFVKDDLADFVREHPDVLEHYKTLKGAKGPLSIQDLEAAFDEGQFAESLRRSLPSIPLGPNDASRYHSFALAVCTFLFHPNLIYPKKEFPLHDGRKRLDIKFTNTSHGGFFTRMLESHQARAISVPIECKNYTKEVVNPEFDQLAGRFGHTRGFFGIMMCRRIDDRKRLTARCKDAALDGRGYIIVLDDEDIDYMLTAVVIGRRSLIDQRLQQRFNEITH